MRIDDLIRESRARLDPSARGGDAALPAAAKPDMAVFVPMSAASLALPDLLLEFTVLIAKRQQLSELLPQAVKERLYPPGESGPVSLSDGMAALVRGNRQASVQARQIAAEMDLIDRVPEWGAEKATAQALSSAIGESLDILRHSTANPAAAREPSAAEAPPSGSIPEPGPNASEPPLMLRQGATASSAGRFESLLSAAASGQDSLRNFLQSLPEAVRIFKSAQAGRSGGEIPPPVLNRIMEQAPPWVSDTARRENSPVILEFWGYSKAADMEPWRHLSPGQRQETAETLKELASTYEQPEPFRASDDNSHRAMTMQTALYAPGAERPYPALVQIFEETKERGPSGEKEQEIWVRVAISTENIGSVDLSFRLQDRKYLTIFSRFADPLSAAEFRSALPEIRRELSDTPLELKKIAVTHRGVGGDDDGGQ